MDMCFIVRKAEELEGRGQEVLKFALSMERVQAVLGNLGGRDRLYDPVTTWLIFLGQTLSPDHSCRNANLSPDLGKGLQGGFDFQERSHEGKVHSLSERLATGR